MSRRIFLVVLAMFFLVLGSPPLSFGADEPSTPSMIVHEFVFGEGAVPAQQHQNPDGSLGGWVADTAYVAPTAYLGPDAVVYGNAWVMDNARVSGRAYIFGYARVFDNARIHGEVFVYGHARIFDYAQVLDNAEVYDNAEVSGNAKIFGYADVFGKAQVSDRATVLLDPLVISSDRFVVTVADNIVILRGYFMDQGLARTVLELKDMSHESAAELDLGEIFPVKDAIVALVTAHQARAKMEAAAEKE